LQNNHKDLRVSPTSVNPERGDAQIWPCEVQIIGTTKTFNAWAVRRIGSACSDIIELMSPDKLREKHDLPDGTKVKISINSSTDNNCNTNDERAQKTPPHQQSKGSAKAIKRILSYMRNR